MCQWILSKNKRSMIHSCLRSTHIIIDNCCAVINISVYSVWSKCFIKTYGFKFSSFKINETKDLANPQIFSNSVTW